MDCEAVDNDGKALCRSCLAEALHEDEDRGSLRVEKTRVVAQHDVVEHDVNVRDFM